MFKVGDKAYHVILGEGHITYNYCDDKRLVFYPSTDNLQAVVIFLDGKVRPSDKIPTVYPYEVKIEKVKVEFPLDKLPIDTKLRIDTNKRHYAGKSKYYGMGHSSYTATDSYLFSNLRYPVQLAEDVTIEGVLYKEGTIIYEPGE